MHSKSLAIAKKYLGKKVKIKIDRPLGSVHPSFKKLTYTSNYGYLEAVITPDGEDLDAYVLGVNVPVDEFEGIVVAIVHRLSDDDDKLVVLPEGKSLSDEEINAAIDFQEKWSRSEHIIIRQ